MIQPDNPLDRRIAVMDAFNYSHISGCVMPHETCGVLEPLGEVDTVCHVYSNASVWQMLPDDQDNEVSHEGCGGYHIWVFCHCRCTMVKVELVQKRGEPGLVIGSWNTRVAAHRWAKAHLPDVGMVKVCRGYCDIGADPSLPA